MYNNHIVSSINPEDINNLNNEDLYNAFVNPETNALDKIHAELKSKESPTNVARYNISPYLTKEFLVRIDNGTFKIKDIITKLNSANISELEPIIVEEIKKNSSSIIPVLKKVAQLKHNVSVNTFFNTLFSKDEFNISKNKKDISETDMNILSDCFKIINIKGDSYVTTFYSYICKLDPRNCLAISTQEVDYLKRVPYNRNRQKLEFIYIFLDKINPIENTFNDKLLVNPDLVKIKNLDDFYSSFLNSHPAKNQFFKNYHAESIIKNAYAQNLGHNFEGFLKEHLSKPHGLLTIGLLGLMMEHYPELETTIVQKFMKTYVESSMLQYQIENSLDLFLKLAPQSINLIPPHYFAKNEDELVKTFTRHPQTIKHWKSENITEAFSNHMSLFLKFVPQLDNTNKIDYLSNMLQNFPFDKLPQNDTTIGLLKPFIEIVNSKEHREKFKIHSLFPRFQKALSNLPINIQEHFLDAGILNYYDVLSFYKKNESSLSFNVYLKKAKYRTLSDFDFANIELQQPIIQNFLNYMENNPLSETIKQLTPPDLNSNDIDFNISMEILLRNSPKELLSALKSVIKSQYPDENPNYENLDELIVDLTTTRNFYSKAFRFLDYYFNTFNTEKVSTDVFISQCYILAEQEKMLQEIPVKASITKSIKF